MISVRGLGKPQYLFRPSQILRRLMQELSPRAAGQPVRLPWGLSIALDPGDTVSKGISAQGLYDLVTTEVLWRLTPPGETCVDVGANIGYVSSLFAARSGPTGKVFAFEPHPRTFEVLQRNADDWNAHQECARIMLVQAALSNVDGAAMLHVPDHNASHAHLSSRSDSGIHVKTVRFDSYFAEGDAFGVVKVDAEGHESAIFAGMAEHFRSGRIRDVVYEENAGYPAESHEVMKNAGYTVLAFEERLSGPRMLNDARARRVKRPHDIPPSYLATRAPERAQRLLSAKGWQSLRGQ